MDKLKELRSMRADKVNEAEEAIKEKETEKAEEVMAEIKELDERISKVEEEIKEIKEDESSNDKEDDKESDEEGEKRSMNNNQFKPSVEQNKESAEVRSFMEYLRSKGQTRSGVTTVGADAVIPKDIVTQPVKLPETVVDLKDFTNVVKVPTGQGSYPVLESATEVMHTVEELKKNPELAEPNFIDVDYKVQTYRGQIAVSEEALQDSTPDLANLVAENNARIGLNTTNQAIANVMKQFTAKDVADTDDIKTVLNVDLDPAYDITFVVSASFFNILDTLKDKNGQYILQQDISSQSGRSLFGRPVYVVSDATFGKNGEAHAFIGDISQAILFADRAQASVRWIDNEIYGQLLGIAQRFDVVKANDKAGYFVTYKQGSTSTNTTNA